jgi:hypothetical protein
MAVASIVEESRTDRELVRVLRTGASRTKDIMPESVVWRTYLELNRRGLPDADRLFIGALRSLHSRRSMAGTEISIHDEHTNEHRLTDDALLAELWRAYKRCIRSNRTGPAFQLLKEIQERLDT